MKIAQRFNVGYRLQRCLSPEGTAEIARIPSAVPSGLILLPAVSTASASIPPWLAIILITCFLYSFRCAEAAQPEVDYAAVDRIFNSHCLDCHAAKDPESQLVLESFETLMKGGEIGSDVLPGNSSDSLLVQMIEGRFEKYGKKKIMPPGKRNKLAPEEIATIRAWIEVGAHGPSAPLAAKELVVPNISPKASPRIPVNALAWSAKENLLAAGRYAVVELRSGAGFNTVHALNVHHGNINALAFLPQRDQLFSAGGQPGVAGEICQWSMADAKLLRSIEGHKDAIYCLALSPDGKILATGSYDQKVKLWDTETGKELRTLSGHNGCVYGLTFRPDGKILASASADRTVKLWDPATGERKDTLAQSLKEVYAVAFAPDGKRLFAGGADNRIRVWEISEAAAETTNPILESRFAHEGAILNLVFSPDGKTLVSSADDRTVKLWDPAEMKEISVLEKQPDWAPALAYISNIAIAVGRLDGSIALYDIPGGKLRLALNAREQVPGPKVKLAGTLEPLDAQVKSK